MNQNLVEKIANIIGPAITAAIIIALEEQLATVETNNAVHSSRASQAADQPEDLMNVKQVAKFLHKKPRTIYDLVSKKLIPHRKTPTGSLLFERREIEEWTKAGDQK